MEIRHNPFFLYSSIFICIPFDISIDGVLASKKSALGKQQIYANAPFTIDNVNFKNQLPRVLANVHIEKFLNRIRVPELK